MNTATKEEGRVIEVAAESFSRREDRALPAVQGAQPTSLMQAITMAASNPAMDMDKIERLFAMHQKVLAQEAEAQFNDAMSRAQRNIVPVVANQKNTHTNSMYADLAAIARVIAPLYTEEGLSISFDSNREVLNADGKPIPAPPAGWFRTVGIVSHSAGHSRIHHIDLPSDTSGSQGKANKTEIQGAISTTTYGRRALTCMVFNVAIGDNDGNAGRGKAEVEPDAEGKAKLEACGSMKSFALAWNALTKEQRKTLHEVRAECEARIKEADKAAQA
jgi:ribosomal protein S5